MPIYCAIRITSWIYNNWCLNLHILTEIYSSPFFFLSNEYLDMKSLQSEYWFPSLTKVSCKSLFKLNTRWHKQIKRNTSKLANCKHDMIRPKFVIIVHSLPPFTRLPLLFLSPFLYALSPPSPERSYALWGLLCHSCCIFIFADNCSLVPLMRWLASCEVPEHLTLCA